MFSVPSRPAARPRALLLALLCLSGAAAADNGLSLDQATRLALEHVPLLEVQRQAVGAAREAAVAAAQLPDPELIAGLAEVPVEGERRYSLVDDPDTELQLGLRQRFPGGATRRLRGRLAELEADRLEAGLAEQRRMIAREAGLAWLQVWYALRAQALIRDDLEQARRQRELAGIGYASGRGAQEQLLAADVALELAADRLRRLEQDEAHARNQLRRWLGAQAQRPLAAELPAWTAPDEAHLLARLAAHPQLQAQDRAVAAAQMRLALAAEAYQPDWSLQLGYGHRAEFDDMASVEIEMALPLFTGQRQDRQRASRQAELAAAEAQRSDWLRLHDAQIRLNLDDWRHLQQRLARYDDALLPAAQQRLDATLAGYGAGSGGLAAVFEARRSLLDLKLMRLELELDAARHQLQLRYFAHEGEAAASPENPP